MKEREKNDKDPSKEVNRVVVRYADGTVLKGTTGDFLPNRPLFHLYPTTGGDPVVVHCKKLKAVFFVRSFRGNPKRQDLRGFLASPLKNKRGRKIAIRFLDGEVICGYTMTYGPGRAGFFVSPSDPRSNNLRAYVISSAMEEIAPGPAADAFVEEALARTSEAI
jgi:hypothetical protein